MILTSGQIYYIVCGAKVGIIDIHVEIFHIPSYNAHSHTSRIVTLVMNT